jgi:hypothetical protein
MLEGRDALSRWGFAPPPRDQVHTFVRLRFLYATDADLKEVGRELDRLVRLRNQAEYQLTASGPFTDASRAQDAIRKAEQNLRRLDAVEADAVRRAAAIAGIRAQWP